MHSDVFKAILAMDAYNRGYEQGIDGLSDAADTAIGNALVFDSMGDSVAQSSDFYAIAYTFGSEKIISYRGTDDASDIWNGWTGGIGNADSPQSHLAFDFYQAVAGAGNHLTANISLTGHSLGGGLAGLVGAVYDQDAVLFNTMTFKDAALGTYTFAMQGYNNTGPQHQQVMADRILESAYMNLLPWGNDLPGIRSLSTEGDVLAANRLFMTGIPKEILDFEADIDLPGALDSVNWHSMSTHVIRLYAQREVAGTDWQKSAGYFIPALYDNALGLKAGAMNIPGDLRDQDHDYAGVMRGAIAYSAINEGTRLFGDTGIKALFNDANQLGEMLGGTGVSAMLQDHAEDLGKIIVQFAGQLAVGKALQADHSAAPNGVVSLSSDKSALTVDFSESTWAMGRSSAQTDIAGRTEMVEGLISSVIADNDKVVEVMQAVWSSSSPTLIDKVTFATSNEAVSLSIANRPQASNKVALTVSGDGKDILVGSQDRDFLYGGDGNDVFAGGVGNDILIGGKGQDVYRFDGNWGNDVIIASDGCDDYGDRIFIDGRELSGWLAYQYGQTVDGNIFPYPGFIDSALQGYMFTYNTLDEKLVIAKGNNSITIENLKMQTSSYDSPIWGGNTLQYGGYFGLYADMTGYENHYTGIHYKAYRDGVASSLSLSTPLVVDTRGDGLHLQALRYGQQFDIDNDGFAENTGWLAKEYYDEVAEVYQEVNDDAFLVVDKNGNGVIDNQGEMFGAGGGQTAWQKLAAYDGNGDGKVTSVDANYAQLKLWVDANGNMRTDAGELATLASKGVYGFTVVKQSYTSMIEGNAIDGKGAWLNATGTQVGSYYDVLFAMDDYASHYVGATLTQALTLDNNAFAYPATQSMGNVPALHYVN